MASDTTTSMLATFRVSHDQLVATMLKLHEDHLIKEQLVLVSIRPESKDDVYTENDQKGGSVYKGFDSKQVVSDLVCSIDSFMGDPPDSNYQCGYLAALVELYRECLGFDPTQGDARIWAAQRLISNAYVSEIRRCARSGPTHGAP